MSSQVSLQRITERVQCLEAFCQRNPNWSPRLETIRTKITPLVQMTRTEGQEAELFSLLPPVTMTVVNENRDHPDYLKDCNKFTTFLQRHEQFHKSWFLRSGILCENLKAYKRENPSTTPRSGEAYTSFQLSLIEAMEEANDVHRLVDALFQQVEATSERTSLKQGFEALESRIQHFAFFPNPPLDLDQEVEIFRFIGVRKIFAQKLLEQLDLPRDPAHLVGQYLALDIEGIETDKGNARGICVYFHTRQYPEYHEYGYMYQNAGCHGHFPKLFPEGCRLLSRLLPKIFPQPRVLEALCVCMVLCIFESQKARSAPTCRVEEIPGRGP